jgi:hypothetical protein
MAAHNHNVTSVAPPFGGYPKVVSQGLNDDNLFLWMQEAGYNTYYVGKLYNFHSVDNFDAPHARGFNGSDFLLDPYTYQYYNAKMTHNGEEPVSYAGQYSTDVVSQKANAWLDEALTKDNPFFLTVAPIAPHSNWVIEPENDLSYLLEPLGADRHKHLFENYTIPRDESYNTAIKGAVGGIYDDVFFGSAQTEIGYGKRLRAVVQHTLSEFAEDMSRNGQDRSIVHDHVEDLQPGRISRNNFVHEVRSLMKRSRGKELPGTFSPSVIGELFFQQVRPWKSMVSRYLQRIIGATELCLKLVLNHIADETTSFKLFQHVIIARLKAQSLKLEIKIDESLHPHQAGHPITYNHYFTDTVQKARDERRNQDLRRSFTNLNTGGDTTKYTTSNDILFKALYKELEQDMDIYSASEAVDCMEASYKVCMMDVYWIQSFSNT